MLFVFAACMGRPFRMGRAWIETTQCSTAPARLDAALSAWEGRGLKRCFGVVGRIGFAPPFPHGKGVD